MMRQSLEPGFARMPGQVIFVMFPFIILNIYLHAFTIFVTSLTRTRRHGERKTNRQYKFRYFMRIVSKIRVIRGK